MQCRRPFGAAVPPFGGITRPPAGGGQASAGLAAGGNGAAGHGAAGTVPGGYGASIEARFHRARHLVPAKAGTVSRRQGVWCRLRPARFLVPPNGAAQNRLAKARLKTGGGPAARRPDWAGGMVPPDWAARGMVPGNCPAQSMVPPDMVPPIGGTVPGGTGNGACNCRHGMVPAKAGTGYGAAYWRHGSWRRGFGPAGTVPPIGGPCWPGGRAELGIPRPGCGVWECGAWECGCLGMRSLGMRMSGNAEPGNADVLECGCPGMRMSGNADVRECGAWGCGCLGACGCPGTRSLGMRSLGMRMSWSMRGPGMRMSGNAELGGNAESGDCPPARSGRRERCRLKWCRPIGRHLPPPEFRRWLAEPPADWPAAGAGGGV